MDTGKGQIFTKEFAKEWHTYPFLSNAFLASLIASLSLRQCERTLTCSISLHFWKQNSMVISSVVDSCSAHIFQSTAMLEVILYHWTLFSKQPYFNSDNTIRMNMNRTIFKGGDIPIGNHLIRGCPLCLMIVFSVLKGASQNLSIHF